jgi:hypothetical protein
MITTTPKLPWQQVGSDLFEWEGHHYIVVVDYFSRFPEARFLANTRTADVYLGVQGHILVPWDSRGVRER